jgi:uncharacterized membrane protein
MSELVIVAFKGSMERAASALVELRAVDEPWTAQLDDAIAVYRDSRGHLMIDESYASTMGQSTIGRGLIGSLAGLALATLLLPLTAGASAPIVGATLLAGTFGGTILGARRGHLAEDWWKSDLGVSPEFADQVRHEIGNCDSAIAVMLPQWVPAVAAKLTSHGGTVIHAELSEAQTEKLRVLLADGGDR